MILSSVFDQASKWKREKGETRRVESTRRNQNETRQEEVSSFLRPSVLGVTLSIKPTSSSIIIIDCSGLSTRYDRQYSAPRNKSLSPPPKKKKNPNKPTSLNSNNPSLNLRQRKPRPFIRKYQITIKHHLQPPTIRAPIDSCYNRFNTAMVVAPRDGAEPVRVGEHIVFFVGRSGLFVFVPSVKGELVS